MKAAGYIIPDISRVSQFEGTQDLSHRVEYIPAVDDETFKTA
jgi:hypothetical protein